jgi:membrane-associated phospholipid phosphatase
LLIFADKQIYLWMRQIHTPWLTYCVDAIKPCGRLGIDGGIGVLLWGLGWIVAKQNLKRAGLSILLSIMLTEAIIGIAKPAIGRIEQFGSQPGWSLSSSHSLNDRWGRFPSGDDGMAFATAGALAGEFPVAAAFYYAVAFLVGFERVYVGSHFASDVFAAALLGIVVARLVTKQRRNAKADVARRHNYRES